jgi:UV DNA damage endonuclease
MEEQVRLGYCCINLDMPKGVSTNRGCIKKTFLAKGVSYASELALANVRDLVEVVKWNERNGIKVYRMSSDIFPWMSEYELSELPDAAKISAILKGLGALVQKYGHRLSFHPGPFNVLGSPNPSALAKTLRDLNQHGEIMDMIGLPRDVRYPINIHCNGVYEGKGETLARWRSAWSLLDDGARLRLVVENDDKASMYSVRDLYDCIYAQIGVPVTFDYHHHRFCPGGLDEEAAFKLAASTWPDGIRPLFHYSSCRRTHEDTLSKAQAHADYVYEKIRTYGMGVDIEVEAKAKNRAVMKYLKGSEDLLESYLPMD